MVRPLNSLKAAIELKISESYENIALTMGTSYGRSQVFYNMINVRLLPGSDNPYHTGVGHAQISGNIIGGNDLFIAAHALALDLTLVSANVREFFRVPSLRVEIWLEK